MLYFLPYAFNLVLLGVLALFYQQVSEQYKKIIVGVCFVYFLLFFGFRGYVWDDWQIYHNHFLNMSWSSFRLNPFEGGKEHFFEPGYVLLNMFVKGIYKDYVFFQFVQTTICCLLLFRFINRKHLNVPFFLMLFLTFGGYEILINLMRNAIAILIFLNALPYLEERKPLPYFLLCTLAVCFHLTSILFFPLYYCLHIKINKWWYLAILGVGLVFFLAHVKLLTPLLSLILGESDSRLTIMAEQYGKIDDAKTLSIGLLERALTGILVFCYYDKLRAMSDKNQIYINALLLYLSILFFFNELAIVSQRLGLLVIFGYWIVWYHLLTAFHYRGNRILFGAFICLYSCLKTIGMCNYPRCEYDNHLFGCKTYEQRYRIYAKDPTK